MKVLLCCLLSFVGFASCIVTPIEDLLNSTCTNCNEIDTALGFGDDDFDPFEGATWAGYETVINDGKDGNCVAVVDPEESRQQGRIVYSLENKRAKDKLKKFEYITNSGACGSCSDLRTLGLYASVDDLEGKVTNCGTFSVPLVLAANGYTSGNPIENLLALNFAQRDPNFDLQIPDDAYNNLDTCIQGSVGLEGACSKSWAVNTLLTAIKCGGICFQAVFQFQLSAIEPVPNTSLPFYLVEDYCAPDTCPNTINGQDACYPEASMVGDPFRLGSCWQCDECHNGPRFLELAGRNRRTSGLVSNIPRPSDTIPDIEHDYCFENCPDVGKKSKKTKEMKEKKEKKTKASKKNPKSPKGKRQP